MGARRLSRLPMVLIACSCATVLLLVGAVAKAGAQGGAKFSVIGDYGSAAPDDQPPDYWGGDCPAGAAGGCVADCPATFARGYESERWVSRLVKETGGTIVTLGDNNLLAGCGQVGGHNFLDLNIGKLFKKGAMKPAIGNHDYHAQAGAPYFGYFGVPAKYEFEQGPTRWYTIDTNSLSGNDPGTGAAEPIEPQMTWLRGRLAQSFSCWNLVYMHHPPYSSHRTYPELQRRYEEWGADAVFAGHDHGYEFLYVDGFPYFVNGIGGGPVYGFTGSHPDSWPGRLFDKKRYGEPHGAQTVAATDGQYAFLQIAFQGKDLDRGTMLSDYWAVMKSCDDPDCLMQYPPCTLDWDVPYTRWQTYGSEPGCTQSFGIDHGDCDNKEAPDYSEEPYCMLSCRTGGTSFRAVFRFYYCCMDPEGDCDCDSTVPWGRATAYNAAGFPIYQQWMITHGCNYTQCAFGDDGPGPLVGVPDRWLFEVVPYGTCPGIGLLGAAVSYQCCDCPGGGPG